jgi:hypothetical protein
VSHIPVCSSGISHPESNYTPSIGNQQISDKWAYIWGSAKYTSSKFYTLSFGSIHAPTPFKWIWKSKVFKKIKIFIWLLFKDRINSRNLLRKNYKIEGDDYNCVLCNLDTEELSYHLIFQCPFSSECWNYIGFYWDHNLHFFDTIQKAKQDCHSGFFMEIFSMAAWEIWKQRNKKIFRGSDPTFQSWNDNFLLCTKSQMYRLNLSQPSMLGGLPVIVFFLLSFSGLSRLVQLFNYRFK